MKERAIVLHTTAGPLPDATVPAAQADNVVGKASVPVAALLTVAEVARRTPDLLKGEPKSYEGFAVKRFEFACSAPAKCNGPYEVVAEATGDSRLVSCAYNYCVLHGHDVPLSYVTTDILSTSDDCLYFLSDAAKQGRAFVTMVINKPHNPFHFHVMDMSFPSGGVERRDEGDFEKTARREMVEETGLTLGVLSGSASYSKNRYFRGKREGKSGKQDRILWFCALEESI